MARRPGLDRRVLVGEAAVLADTRGLDFVTMANLAARLNVRVPSLYNHVDCADELQRELTLYAMRGLAGATAHAAIGKNGGAGLLAIANAYRAFAKEHPGLYAATLRRPRSGDEEMLAVMTGFLDVLGLVLEPFKFKGDRLIHVMRGFRSIVHGFVSLEAAQGFGFPQSTDESFKFILHLFVSGLSAENHEEIGNE